MKKKPFCTCKPIRVVPYRYSEREKYYKRVFVEEGSMCKGCKNIESIGYNNNLNYNKFKSDEDNEKFLKFSQLYKDYPYIPREDLKDIFYYSGYNIELAHSEVVDKYHVNRFLLEENEDIPTMLKNIKNSNYFKSVGNRDNELEKDEDLTYTLKTIMFPKEYYSKNISDSSIISNTKDYINNDNDNVNDNNQVEKDNILNDNLLDDDFSNKDKNLMYYIMNPEYIDTYSTKKEEEKEEDDEDDDDLFNIGKKRKVEFDNSDESDNDFSNTNNNKKSKLEINSHIDSDDENNINYNELTDQLSILQNIVNNFKKS